ncbi:MAG: hypothetical protein ABL958_14790 [Bdellovibrionia bacterium]
MFRAAVFLISALAALSFAVETKDPCFISTLEQERLSEFMKIKEYLTSKVFGPWDKDLPPLFFYDNKCQFILNYADAIPEGFTRGEQVLNVAGFSTTAVYFKPTTLKLPMGQEIAVRIVPAAKTVVDPKGKAWTVMALYPVWKSEFSDKLEFYYGNLAHEMFHPFQYKYAKVKAVLANANEDQYTAFAQENTAFQLLVGREQAALKSAILSEKESDKRAFLKKFFEVRRKRRDAFFTAEKVKWGVYEPGIEAVEGVAEYLNLRVMTDSKKFVFNRKLKSMDPDYHHYASFRPIGLKEALEVAAKSKSYTQVLGVYQATLLNQVVKNWQPRVFEEDRFIEGLLQEWLVLR